MSSKKNKPNYKKAIATITYFNNNDVITTSGGFNACEVWSSINGYECHMNLQLSGDGLKPPLN